MRWNYKTFVLLIGGFLAFTLLASYLSAQNFLKETSAQLKQTLNKEVSLIAQLAQVDIKQMRDQLTWLFLNKEDPNFQTFLEQTPFLHVIGLQQNETNPSMSVVWAKNQASPELLKSAQAVVQTKLAQDFEFRRFVVDGEIFFSVLVRFEQKIAPSALNKMVLAGVLPLSFFQTWVASALGTSRELAVVDQQGFSLAYTNQQYAGASLSKHPVVEQALLQTAPQLSLEGKNLKGHNSFFSLEKLPKTNLIIISMQQELDYFHTWSRAWFELSGYSVGIFLILLGLLYKLFGPIEKTIEYFSNMVVALNERAPLAYPEFAAEDLLALEGPLSQLIESSKTGSALPLEATELKSEAGPEKNLESVRGPENNEPKNLDRGLALALKDPLNAILGSAQKIGSNLKAPDLKQHVLLIEREARRGKKSIQHLLQLTRPNEENLENLDLRDVLLQTLAEVEGDLKKAGIELVQKLSSTGKVLANQSLLKKIFLEVIANATEAMANSQLKRLTVETLDQGNHLKVRVSDTGKGMSNEEVSQVFEPFYTTKHSDEKEGLGLTVVRGAIASFQGSIRCESKLGSGSRFEIDLPLSQSSKLQPNTIAKQVSAPPVHLEQPDPIEQSEDPFQKNETEQFIRLSPKPKPKQKPNSHLTVERSDPEEDELRQLLDRELYSSRQEKPSGEVLQMIRKPVVRVKN